MKKSTPTPSQTIPPSPPTTSADWLAAAPTSELTFAQLPQREKKHARTRLGLLDALVIRLERHRLEDIAVKELAAEVGVSPATVFNHFANKGELLTYFIVLWGIEVGLLARQIVRRQTDSSDNSATNQHTYNAIASLLTTTGGHASAHPGLMLEIIAHQARMPRNIKLPTISRGERLLRFGAKPGVLTQPAGGLEVVLPRLLERAVTTGELPPTSDTQLLTLAIASIFFGVPLLLARHQPEAISACYLSQLALIWAGAQRGPI